MKTHFLTTLAAALLATTSITAHAATKNHSRTIVVQSPFNLPVLAQKDSEAMYLHLAGDGKTLLYIEANSGNDLTILDVTDPARVKRVVQTTVGATSTYDFVKAVGEHNVLLRYRNGSGEALLRLKDYKHPQLVAASALAGTEAAEKLGETGLLTASTAENNFINNSINDPTYKVWDNSKPAHPNVLASIPGVMQRLSKEDTGTLFLLSSDGVTMVRRLRVEEDHKIDVIWRSQT